MSTGLDMFGTAMDTKEKVRASKFQSNLAIGQANAEVSIGNFERYQKTKEFDAYIGEQIVAYSKSGVRSDYGSAETVITNTMQEQELELSLMKYNTDVRYSTLIAQSKEYKKQARAALISGGIKMASQAANSATGKSYLGV